MTAPAIYGERVRLRREGALWKGCCPFHDEKTPSFTVFPDARYYCFGCGAHGDAIDFARRTAGLSFAEAAERLGHPRPARRKSSTATSNYAARLAAEAQPLAGTLAEHYLRTTRGLGDLPLPAEARFHPAVWSQETASKHPALLIPCFEDGRMVRVQAILLDPATDGKAALQAPKLTFGAGYSHVPAVFQARWPDDWVLLTEGPEDAIVLNAVTERRADASLGAGSLSKPDYPAGAKLLIVGDNGATGHAQAEAAAVAHRTAGATVRVIFPPDGAKDSNDLLCQQGPVAVRVWINAAIIGFDNAPDRPTGGLPAYYPAPTETREEAQARQNTALEDHAALAELIGVARRELERRRAKEIEAAGGEDAVSPGRKATITKRLNRAVAAEFGFEARLPLPPAKLFTGAQGSRKTTVMRHFIANDRSRSVWMFTEPTLAKAHEEYDAYRQEAVADSPPAMLMRGRDRPDPKRPGHLMCDRNATAERVAQAGLSVVKNLCLDCKLAAACGDRRQRREAEELADAGRGAVFFMAGEYAHVPSPAPRPDHVVLDDPGQASNREVLHLPPLDPDAIKDISQTTYKSLQVIGAALADEKPLAKLRADGIDRTALGTIMKELSALLTRQTPEISGAMPDAQIITALDLSDVGPIRHALAILGAVRTEIDQPRDTLTAVKLKSRTGKVRITRRRPLRNMKRASLTILDGTGDIELARKAYGPRLEHVHVPFPRLLHVIGSKGKGYSRQSITGQDRNGKPIESREGGAARLREELATIKQTHLPSGSLVCATKGTVDSLFETGAVAEGTPAAWFSNLRGKNEWEHCPGGLFVGAEQISIEALEDLACIDLADDPVPFISMDEAPPPDWGYQQWPYKVTRMRRMRDGSLSPVEVSVHPDPRVQRVHEQVREAEVMQGIDRLRSIWKRRQIVVLNDLCLDLTYDVIYRHRELVAGGNPLERAYRATGFVPLSPVDLHRLHPSIFKSAKAAEHALIKYPLNPNRGPIWECGVFKFRRLGQRGRDSRVLIDPTRYPDPRAAVEAAFGPLQAFQGVSCTSAPSRPRVGGLRPISPAAMVAGLMASAQFRPPPEPDRTVPDG